MNDIVKIEEDIECFISWLRKFYLMTAKQKTKVIKKISKKNKIFGEWLESVRDFDIDSQFELANHLRCSEW